MGQTKIEWTDVTWNPVTGCAKISPGCKNCYAERMAKRLAGRAGYPREGPFRVTLHRDKLKEPYHWRDPRMVFVCSMGDLFHQDAVDSGYTEDVLAVIADARSEQHTFQLLTKRPDVALEFIAETNLFDQYGSMQHVWWGTTVEDQERDWRIQKLLQIPAAVRFISAEPLLGPIRFPRTVDCGKDGIWCDPFRPNNPNAVNWVVVGGETGPGRRWCDPVWVKDIVRQCLDAGVPPFVKKLHKPGTGRLPVIVDDINEISNLLGYPPEQLRQFPMRNP